MVEDVQICCPTANSDNNFIMLTILAGVERKSSKQEGYNFLKAEYGRIYEQLASIVWKISLDGENIETIWKKIKEELGDCVEKYVQRKEFEKKEAYQMDGEKHFKINKIRWKRWQQCIEKPSHENQMRYKKKRNEVLNEIRKAKLNFELRLSENIKVDHHFMLMQDPKVKKNEHRSSEMER
jgi:hypothetical protein